MEIFSPVWNLHSLNRHEISFYILSNTNVKIDYMQKFDHGFFPYARRRVNIVSTFAIFKFKV